MEFMQAAIKEGVEGVENGHGGPFGAVIVKDNKIVAYGHNKVLVDKDPTAHAETTAIRNACKKLDTYELIGCVLYTSCYPCPMCLGAALWAKIDAVYYATSIRENPDTSNYKLERLEIEDKMKPFKTWEEKEDKINYTFL